MKKIYGIFSTILFYSSHLIKKTKKTLSRSKMDNFIGGLLVGAIVSLLVNYITFQVQDQLQKQRILEAIENEVLNNTINANTLMQSNTTSLKNNLGLNYFYTSQKYSKDIWDSSNVLSYVVQLPKNEQTALYAYYLYVEKINELTDKTEKLREANASKCTALLNQNNTIPDTNFCNALNQELIREDNSAAYNIATQGLNLLKIFHPTKDRVNNFFLSFFLGRDSLYVLTH